MSPKAICLVVVSGGVADAVHPEHVECQIIDFDNIEAGDPPVELPRGVGYEALVRDAGLTEGEGFTWAPEAKPKRAVPSPYKVFEYIAKVKGDPVRWVAARSPESADSAARRRGWRAFGRPHNTGAGEPIYYQPKHRVPQTPDGLKTFGCDLVVP